LIVKKHMCKGEAREKLGRCNAQGFGCVADLEKRVSEKRARLGAAFRILTKRVLYSF